MNQSQHDPTLKVYFTQDEARQWIRHLEKIVDNEKTKNKKLHESNAKLDERFKHFSAKCKRLDFQNEYLENRVKQLEEFISSNGLEPPEAEPTPVVVPKKKDEENP
jgi:predicted nuclease with TOPRIM domain